MYLRKYKFLTESSKAMQVIQRLKRFGTERRKLIALNTGRLCRAYSH